MVMKCICGSNQLRKFERDYCDVTAEGKIPKARGEKLALAECNKCGIIRRLNMPFSTDKEYIKYYSEIYPPNKKAYEAKDYQHDRKLAALRCDVYEIKKGKEEKILDVGAGSGAFVDECRARGMISYGCEIAEYSYKPESKNGFIYQKRLEDIFFPTDHFDKVTCHDVLEHTLNPVQFTEEMFRITKQEGMCIIDLPNFFVEEGKHHWKKEHFWYFSTSQLKEMLMQIGFIVDKITYPIKSKVVFYCIKPKQKRVSILLPPGIGDSYWVITKLQAFIKRENLGIPDVSVMCNTDRNFKTHERAFPFVEMFPFLNSTNVARPITKDSLIWKEAYIKRGRTIFKNIMGYDYFISYNGVLESGLSLEDTDLDLKCNFSLPRFISLEEEGFRKKSIQKYGKYIVFYFVFQGTFKNWTRELSLERIVDSIERIIGETNATPIFVGADWDKKDKLLNDLKKKISNCIDLTGKTSVSQLFGLIRGSEMVIGFPCGLTMTAAMLKAKVLMIWNDWHRNGFKWGVVPPDVKNKTCFIENTKNFIVDEFVQKAKSIFHRKSSTKDLAMATSYETRMYDYMRNISSVRVKRYGMPTESRALDINSEAGTFVDECRENGVEAYGCELLKYDYQKNDEFIYRKELEDIYFPTDHFDFITCHKSIGYKLDPIRFFKEVFRILKQEGIFILNLSKKEHLNHWFYSPEQMRVELKKIGFEFNSMKSIEKETIFYCTKPIQVRPKILLPPGIGDSYWEITKLQAFLKRENLDLPDIYVASRREKKFDAHKRAFPFIEMFPFLNASNVMKDVGPRASENFGIWNEAYRNRGRTIFEKVLGCDYFLCHNGYLATGDSLEDIDADLKCDWHPPIFVSLEQEKFRKECIRKYGKYIVFYFVFHGSYSTWKEQFPINKIIAYIKRIIEKTQYIPIFAGALWDKDEQTLKKVITSIPGCVNMLGKTSVDQLFGLIRGSELLAGYPSGLTILSTVLKKKTLIIWNDFYHKNFAWHTCPPDTWNKTYFVENTKGIDVDGLVQTSIDIIEGKATHSRLPLPDTRIRKKRRAQLVFSKLKKAKSTGEKKKVSVTVICVLKSGGIYTADYVLKLRNMIRRHSTVDYEFVCLTDVDIDESLCKRIKLVREYNGWWSKIEIFRPDLVKTGRIVYFDLDTVILKNIDDILTYNYDISALQPWNERNRKKGLCASGMMAWRNDGLFSFLFEKFKLQNIKNYKGGDQEYISKILADNNVSPEFFQKLFSGIYSYKRNCRKGIPKDARIICFHGRPRPHEMKDKWMRENWK